MSATVRAHWLTERRIVLYSATLVLLVLIYAGGTYAHYRGLADALGRPYGADFIAFWGASHIGLGPRPQDAYIPELIFQAEKLAVPGLQYTFAWFYPPTFYLLVLPLALLPYLAAYLAFIGATLAFYVAVFRRVLQGRSAMLCLAAFPGLWFTILCGQNAFLTSALAALALLLLGRRPLLAGACIGLLAIKPHLALLFPVALLAAGAWRTLATAVLVALAFLALSIAVLGLPSLAGFGDSLAFARSALEQGDLPWHKMPSVFVAARMLQLPVAASYALHAAAAAAAAALVWRAWRMPAPPGLRAAILLTASTMASPFIYDYDLAVLAFPLAWYVQHALRHGWLRGERELLVAVWLMPGAMSYVAQWTSVQLAPLLVAGLLYALLRRARLAGQHAAG